jgi:chitinase
MALPAKVVALYYMMWSNSGSPRLRTIPRGVNVVNLAFVQGDPPAIVDWGAQGRASFVADARVLRARGVRVVASVGGAGGHVNIANRSRFIAGVMALNAKTPLDGLDWDLEGTRMGAADVVYISKRLKQLRGRNFSITMAPNGSNIDQYRAIAVRLQRAGALSLIGQQFYDAVVSKQAAHSRVAQLVAAGIPQSRIAIGMMVGNEDHYWTVTESAAAVRHIKRSYPRVRGGYLWESGRPGTADWVRRVGALLRSS